LLNRRNSTVEPSLFASELEKFKPFQLRIASTIQYQQAALQEIASFWKALRDLAGKGAGARKWEEKEKRKTQLVKRFARAKEGWFEVKEGVGYVISSHILWVWYPKYVDFQQRLTVL